MPTFSIVVPFESVIHESLDSRVFTNIPDADLADGMRIRGDESGYTVELEIGADHPRAAKARAIDQVERLLTVLASWNHGFQIRIGGVRSQVIDRDDSATVTLTSPGVVSVSGSEALYLEEHLEVVVAKANLVAEDAFLQRYEDVPEYVRSCLELNYLIVLSTRPPNRWLLAATGLEALTIGTIGAQQTVSPRLDGAQRKLLRAAVTTTTEEVGLGEMSERVVERVLSTTVGPVADHVHRYLRDLGIQDASLVDIRRWWKIRGVLAHGGAVEVDLGELNHLITVFQVALRRTAGVENVPDVPSSGSRSPASTSEG